MKAIILAAGYGNRMRPLTDTTHKTLLRVNGSIIIERMIDGLLANGITDIAVVTGYRARELRAHLQKRYPELDFQFVHNARYRETNNIYSLALAMDAIELDDDIILIESDLIYAPEVIETLLQSRHENVALVDHYNIGMDGTVVTLDADGVVTSVIPPHLQGAGFNYADKYKTLNIYKFSRHFCATRFKQLLTYYAKTIDANCYYELILGVLIYMQKETIYGAVVNSGTWTEVDDANDLTVAEYQFNPPARLEIVKKAQGGFWNLDMLDFCFLRNAYFPTRAMLSTMRAYLDRLIFNYGSAQPCLNRKLSYFLLCRPEHVQLLNGCAQVYPWLKHYFHSRRVWIPEPTFGEYARAFPRALRYDARADFALPALEDDLQPGDICVVVNPNNPTGATLPQKALFQWAEAHPQNTLIVDESFLDFSDEPPLIPMLEEKPLTNIVVLKSLSKVLGVPGLRLGYIYTPNQPLLGWLAEETPIWNSNSLAEFFLELLLKNRGALAQSFERTRYDRAGFAEALRKVPCIAQVYPSGANFLLCRFQGPAHFWSGLAADLLARRKIYIKDVTEKMRDGSYYARFAVRLPEENAQLAAALAQYDPPAAQPPVQISAIDEAAHV